MSDIREQVREYYSKVTVDADGQMATHTCSCGTDAMPTYIREVLAQVPEGITSRFYGCGSPLPPALEGCTVLDLGCGTGRDVYLASKLVGPNGRVIGIDMNADQLAVAEGHHAEMVAKWGYDNVEFHEGFIEDLEGIADGSVDVVISNCVVNLSPMKERVFSEIWRVLKEGGELYFSDIFADRRVPESIANDPLLLGECLGGALYIEDFRRMMAHVGWKYLWYVSLSPATIDNEQVEALVGDVRFASATVRALKLPGLVEDICEQYGQHVTYNGGIPGCEDAFVLDRTHTYPAGERKSACGNPAAAFGRTRYAAYFTVEGDRSSHRGACCGGVLKDMDWDGSCCTGATGGLCCGESASGETCCGSGDECCSDDDCCADDAFLGEKREVLVEYLYLDQSVCTRCQGTDERVEQAIRAVAPVFDMAGYSVRLVRTEMSDERIAIEHKFLSSPTVRVNGVDICPEVIENECDCCKPLSDYDVNCRQFDFNGRLYEVPPTAYVAKRLCEIVFGGEQPSDEPYELPANLKGFFEGKVAK